MYVSVEIKELPITGTNTEPRSYEFVIRGLGSWGDVNIMADHVLECFKKPLDMGAKECIMAP